MTRIDKDTDSLDTQSQDLDSSITRQETGCTPHASHSPLASEIDGLLSSYDYELPQERIAQTPLSQRDSSRMLVVDSPIHHTHSIFHNLPNLLRSGDLLVLNNTRVIPARLYGRKSTGAPVEVLLLEEQQDNCWLALVKPGRRLKPGAKILFEAHTDRTQSPTPTQLSDGGTPPLPTLNATVVARDEATNGRVLQFDVPPGASLAMLLEQYGQIPLPPYITNTQASPEQYQTIYAQTNGAIAAPTAGLHFTDELLKRCQEQGIQQTSITLHVGVGTFRPVEVDNVTAHKMHSEWVEVSESTVEQIRETKAKGGRVIAVGTTVVRALESAAASGEVQPFTGKTELFIYPGYQWRAVEGLITNFHLPRSSLLMLVSAMIVRQRLLDLYKEAIAHEYRFYSFGDAMLILPESRKVVTL
ncbi:MAG: tRNA preQ1(34) S-adenosylmethionine ribosyltransferase-isomerase QueA [Microcoleus sp. SIO2G3]|nr:tRNA preQ1(34) S-adenosylmethionine ribosyltransferase-isomerase QueA [Microcoleus sp. SIO2G3]